MAGFRQFIPPVLDVRGMRSVAWSGCEKRRLTACALLPELGIGHGNPRKRDPVRPATVVYAGSYRRGTRPYPGWPL